MIVTAVLVALAIVVLLFGRGQHGPARHPSSVAASEPIRSESRAAARIRPEGTSTVAELAGGVPR